MSAKILTYPWSVNYPTDTTAFRSEVMDPLGESSGVPVNNEIWVPGNNTSQTDNTGYKWESPNGGYAEGTFGHIVTRKPVNTNGGFDNTVGWRWKVDATTTNNTKHETYIDIGAEGGKTDGSSLNNTARSSWMRGVTGLWCLFNVLEMQNQNNCSGSILRAAIRYKDPSRNTIRFKHCTLKKGSLGYGDRKKAGASNIVFGYCLDSADRDTVERNDWRLLGFRLHLRLWREDIGTHKDYLRLGISALTPSFYEPYTYNSNAKRVVCRKHDTMLSDYNGRWNIEMRND